MKYKIYKTVFILLSAVLLFVSSASAEKIENVNNSDKFRNGSFAEKIEDTGMEKLAATSEEGSLNKLKSAASDPNDFTKQPTKSAEKKLLNTTISVDFNETPIDQVLKSIAMQADADIIKSPAVTGTVTATLTDIPLNEALTNILSAHGYAYTATKNMILVMPKSEIAAERQKMATEVYKIKYADPADIFQTLSTYLSPEGKMAFNIGSSTLMITDTESNMEYIAKFIRAADTETPQVLIEARIYDVTSTDALDLGVQWNAGKNTNFESGISTLGGNKTGDTNPFATGSFDGQINKTDQISGLFRYGYLTDSLDIDTIIRAEDQEANAKLLANPSILTLDNEPAMIQIVKEIPYQELTQTSEGGSIGTTEFREVGVILEVTPHVTSEDQVRLHIRPEFSVAVGDVKVVGSDSDSIDQPIVDTRRADTRTLVKDGQTIVIGGLKQKTLNQQTNKIPWLGDLPIIGWAFKFEGEEEVYSELLLFITPRIVRSPKITPAQQDRLDETNIEMVPRVRSLRQRHEGLKRKDKTEKKQYQGGRSWNM